jgi:cytochrome c6
MRKCLITTVCMLAATGLVSTGFAAEAKGGQGEDLFKKHCAACHAHGGNTVNPKKTLARKDREANGVKTAQDVIRNMRNPGPGMTTFDEKAVPEKDAKTIADYIIKTFN